MVEEVVIKCPACGHKFYKKEIGNEPIVLHCKCKNVTIEIKTKEEDERRMFLVSFGENPPLISFTEPK